MRVWVLRGKGWCLIRTVYAILIYSFTISLRFCQWKDVFFLIFGVPLVIFRCYACVFSTFVVAFIHFALLLFCIPLSAPSTCAVPAFLFTYLYKPLGAKHSASGQAKAKMPQQAAEKKSGSCSTRGAADAGQRKKRSPVEGKARCPGRYRPADRILHSDLLKRPARSIRPVILRGFALFPRFLLTLAPLRVILLTDSGLF